MADRGEPIRDAQAALQRARALGGLRVGELAAALGLHVPPDLRRHKGFVGQLIERALGVNRSSAKGPDLPEAGVEIKTLPIDALGRPLESTFVCTLRLIDASEACWEASALRAKLRHVLWVPVQGERTLALSTRRIGSAFLWQPSEGQWAALEADWTELVGYIGRVGPEGLSAHRGLCLQVRPKAPNARARTGGRDADGAPVRVPPRAFYLRAAFTRTLLDDAGAGRA